MGRRINAVKEHLTKYKWYYISAGLVVGTAGITYLIVRGSHGSCLAVATNELPRSTMDTDPPTISQTMVSALGNAGAAKGGPAVPGKTSVNALEVNRGGSVLGNSHALTDVTKPENSQVLSFGNVIGNNHAFDITQIIESHRQGPPSWVIRCVETGELYSSQRKAAAELGLSELNLSRHLNGLLDHVNDLHFERICIAA